MHLFLRADSSWRQQPRTVLLSMAIAGGVCVSSLWSTQAPEHCGNPSICPYPGDAQIEHVPSGDICPREPECCLKTQTNAAPESIRTCVWVVMLTLGQTSETLHGRLKGISWHQEVPACLQNMQSRHLPEVAAAGPATPAKAVFVSTLWQAETVPLPSFPSL